MKLWRNIKEIPVCLLEISVVLYIILTVGKPYSIANKNSASEEWLHPQTPFFSTQKNIFCSKMGWLYLSLPTP